MARVTVDDCLKQIPNRFHLVLAGAKRAREIAMGADVMVPLENDKPTVLALREIAEKKVGMEVLDDVSAQAHAGEPLVSADEVREEI
jgi:DNA-directed RNA polymerase subunit omega